MLSKLWQLLGMSLIRCVVVFLLLFVFVSFVCLFVFIILGIVHLLLLTDVLLQMINFCVFCSFCFVQLNDKCAWMMQKSVTFACDWLNSTSNIVFVILLIFIIRYSLLIIHFVLLRVFIFMFCFLCFFCFSNFEWKN